MRIRTRTINGIHMQLLQQLPVRRNFWALCNRRRWTRNAKLRMCFRYSIKASRDALISSSYIHRRKLTIMKVCDEVSQITTHVTHMNSAMEEGEKRKILTWLSPVDYGPQQSDHFSRRQEGTGQWLLDSDPFQQWLEQSKTTLFCQGIPGAGKTIMASIVVNYLGIKFKDDCHVAVAYIFCNFRRQNEQTSTDLLTSLLKQLACQTPTLPKCLKNLFGNHKNQQTRPTSDEIWTALHTIGSSYEKVFIVIDALDECQVSEVGVLSSWLSFLDCRMQLP